jgi:hypothetical protein
MSRRFVFAALALFALSVPALAQVPVSNANSFELENGVENFIIYVATTTPTIGNVAGTGVVNLTPLDHMFWQIMPKEYLHSSNGTNPGTTELVSLEVDLIHSFFGSGGGGTPSTFWDITINPVTYVNPISLLGPDGRRYPDLSVAPLITLLGGPSGLPAPVGCAAPQYWYYSVGIELGTATPGSGIIIPADGNTDLSLTFWSPGGMTATPPDPSGCEVGGNLSMMTLQSTNEHVPNGVTTGAATPLPAGNNRNPFAGLRALVNLPPAGTNFNSRPNINSWEVFPGFRDPTLQFMYFYSSGGPSVGGAMAAPERGSGALFMDASTASTMTPGFRTCASGHLGELVIHVLTADVVNFPAFGAPGIPVTPTSNLMLNPADPSFFMLTPLMDGLMVSNTVDYFFAEKHTFDTPMSIGLTGPIPPPGINFLVQAFIVNINTSPVSVVSTNVAHGNVW